MARTIKDITNEIFGELTVIDFDHLENHMTYWKCKCNCGNEKIIAKSNLISGATKSCGCLSKEKRNTKEKKKPTKIRGKYMKYLEE